MILREETARDIEDISEVTAAAFKDLAVSNQTEPYIIAGLREAGALRISLVAEIGGRIVGHAAFSPVKIEDGAKGWYGLGPISVLPEYQRQGIGQALLNRGLEMLRESGGQGCLLVGHPEYYKRFGFRNYPELVYEGVPPEVFMALPFCEKVPTGRVVFHEAFSATE
jgi:putative acetyltransferase